MGNNIYHYISTKVTVTHELNVKYKETMELYN